MVDSVPVDGNGTVELVAGDMMEFIPPVDVVLLKVGVCCLFHFILKADVFVYYSLCYSFSFDGIFITLIDSVMSLPISFYLVTVCDAQLE